MQARSITTIRNQIDVVSAMEICSRQARWASHVHDRCLVQKIHVSPFKQMARYCDGGSFCGNIVDDLHLFFAGEMICTLVELCLNYLAVPIHTIQFLSRYVV